MERSSELLVKFQNSGGETELVKSETENEQFWNRKTEGLIIWCVNFLVQE